MLNGPGHEIGQVESIHITGGGNYDLRVVLKGATKTMQHKEMVQVNGLNRNARSESAKYANKYILDIGNGNIYMIWGLMKYIKCALLVFLMVLSASSFAGIIDCGPATVSKLYVQGDRSDGSFHANKLIIIMGQDKKSQCSDFTFAYLENNDEAYQGILSMAITAFTAGKKLRVVVNDGAIQDKSRRIEWVNF